MMANDASDGGLVLASSFRVDGAARRRDAWRIYNTIFLIEARRLWQLTTSRRPRSAGLGIDNGVPETEGWIVVMKLRRLQSRGRLFVFANIA